jgi:hypothetical protein
MQAACRRCQALHGGFAALEPVQHLSARRLAGLFPPCFAKFFCNTYSIAAKICLRLAKKSLAIRRASRY